VTSTEHPDVVVVGLGGMGSAAAYHLARRGMRVVGLERFTPAHDRGSSHGESRIIRQAYFEHPDYVPLVLRAYELWRELEDATDTDLLTVTGGLYLGPPDCPTVEGSRRSAELHGLPHELLDAAEVRRRHPTFAVPDGVVGLYEPAAGVVRPEAAVTAHLELAGRAGADLRFGVEVLGWTASASTVVVHTADGDVEAGRLVVCPGAWASRLLADLGVPFAVERQVQHWWHPADLAPYAADRHPVWIWESAPDVQGYGFPALPGGDGVKTAFFRAGGPTDPDALTRDAYPAEVEAMRAWLQPRLSGLAADHLRAAACLYTNSPDHHFVVACHPRHRHISVAAGFSGHGFKFAAVIGEVLADLAIDGRTDHPIELFDPARFG